MADSDSQFESQRFQVLCRYRDLPDALLYESILDSAAIECFLADENTIRMDWFWSNLLGGIKLCARNADVDTALSLLGQGVPERFDVEGVGEYSQPRCPTCQSLEISFRGLNKPVDYTRALLGEPRPLHRSLWECGYCGHQWPESSEKPPANFLAAASSMLMIVIALENVGFFAWLVIHAVHFATSR
jgi:hypothetical protein